MVIEYERYENISRPPVTAGDEIMIELIYLAGNRGLKWILLALTCAALGTIFICGEYCESVLHMSVTKDRISGHVSRIHEFSKQPFSSDITKLQDDGRPLYELVEGRKTKSLPGEISVKVGQDPNDLKEIKGLSSRSAEIGLFPMTPAEAISLFGDKMPWWERYEILHYTDVWFLGLDATKRQISYDPAKNFGFSDRDKLNKLRYKLVIGDHIAYRYEIEKPLSGGAKGVVRYVRDWAVRPEKSFAMKTLFIIRSHSKWNVTPTREVEIMNVIAKNAKNQNYFPKMVATFKFRNHQCIVFELLGPKMEKYVGSNMTLFRQFAEDMLFGMYYLHDMKIIHSDLHLKNVMYVRGKNNQSSGQLLKIMDFGESYIQDDDRYNWHPSIQTPSHRAPEVILGLPHTTQIDMWSIGIMFVELFLGFPPYSTGNDNTELLANMIKVIGPPPIDMFVRSNKKNFYEEVTSYEIKNRIHHKPLQKQLEDMDPALFDLISRLLEYDPKTRMTAEQALRHPFITGIHPVNV